MDLLFKRYASPFVLLDQMIACRNFESWIDEFIDAENERQLWETWLNKETGKSYPEFKEAVMDSIEGKKVDNKKLEATITNSQTMLNNFTPPERG